MAYTPVLIELGPLPECPDEIKKYSFADIPSNTKEILVYSFVTTHNDGPFQRGYYTLKTVENLLGGEPKEYTQYLNVATGKPAVTVNSANMWFPLGNAGELVIQLIHPADKKCSIAHKAACGKPGDSMAKEWSNVFIIGYR